MTDVTLTVSIKRVARGGLLLPPGTFMFVKHDEEAADGLQRIGMPEVYPLYLSKYCELTADWQWFCFRTLIHSYSRFAFWNHRMLTAFEFNVLSGRFKSLYKQSEAFTNFKGFPNCTNYISGEEGAGNPGQEPIICCGNVVKVLGTPIRLAGEMCTPIETLDGAYPPPDIAIINRITAPHVMFAATNVAANKSDPKNWVPFRTSDGRIRVDAFPHLQQWGRDTLVPLRTNGREAEEQRKLFEEKEIDAPAGRYTRNGVRYAVNYITTSRLKSIAGRYVPYPYVA